MNKKDEISELYEKLLQDKGQRPLRDKSSTRKTAVVVLKTHDDTDEIVEKKIKKLVFYAKQKGYEVVAIVVRKQYGLFTPSVELQNLGDKIKLGEINHILILDPTELAQFHYDLIKYLFNLLGADVEVASFENE
ncbi:MAG: recombinase family protein [Candidatus Rehaiarchaeum fermentans]|nr:recombinase family protein [Candidatus Rehaiarchaeum fermentans]